VRGPGRVDFTFCPGWTLMCTSTVFEYCLLDSANLQLLQLTTTWCHGPLSLLIFQSRPADRQAALPFGAQFHMVCLTLGLHFNVLWAQKRIQTLTENSSQSAVYKYCIQNNFFLLQYFFSV
jgi:hypothetical protein